MSKNSIKESTTAKKTLKSRDDKRLSNTVIYQNSVQKFAKNPLVFTLEKQRSKLHKSMINSNEANKSQIELKLESFEDKKSYIIFWQDLCQERNKGLLLELKIDANPNTIVRDFLGHIITKINKRLTESRSRYMLSNNKDLFGLMIAKKNGEPKTDYPEFDKEQLIQSSGSINFFLKPKEACAIVWLTSKYRIPVVDAKNEECDRKIEGEFTDSKSSENDDNLCGPKQHYRNSLILSKSRFGENIIQKSKKPFQTQSWFFRFFCSFPCFN